MTSKKKASLQQIKFRLYAKAPDRYTNVIKDLDEIYTYVDNVVTSA